MKASKPVVALALLVCTSIAYAGKKANWSSTYEDLVVLSELTSNVPGQSGHVIKQIAETWTHHSKTDPMWEGATAVGVEHQDINNGNVTVHGYGTSTVEGGDKLSFSWQGSGIISPQQELTRLIYIDRRHRQVPKHQGRRHLYLQGRAERAREVRLVERG
jgi:hypothetical protein